MKAQAEFARTAPSPLSIMNFLRLSLILSCATREVRWSFFNSMKYSTHRVCDNAWPCHATLSERQRSLALQYTRLSATKTAQGRNVVVWRSLEVRDYRVFHTLMVLGEDCFEAILSDIVICNPMWCCNAWFRLAFKDKFDFSTFIKMSRKRIEIQRW